MHECLQKLKKKKKKKKSRCISNSYQNYTVFLNNYVDFPGEKRFSLLQIKGHILAEELLVMTEWKQCVHFINVLPLEGKNVQVSGVHQGAGPSEQGPCWQKVSHNNVRASVPIYYGVTALLQQCANNLLSFYDNG